MSAPLWQRDATGLAEAYRNGTATPADSVRLCLDRIDRLDTRINAFVALNPEAEREAEASARRFTKGRSRGPLDGVPVAVKDNLVVAGLPAAWGSRVFAGKLWNEDELPVRRLREAGAIVLGKTNVPEFAVEGYTGNALFGVTGNPWNPELTPGGSSGGAVAAVAAGLVPVAVGTDGGGSIRRPAGYCGLVGLKPTIGRVPRAGGLPQILLDFEVAGPLTRSVRDARLLFEAMAGGDRADPVSRSAAAMAREGQPLRILCVPRLGAAPCEPVILQALADAAEALSALGHRVEEGALPFDLGPLDAFWGTIAEVGLARMKADLPQMEQAGAKYLVMAEAGEKVPAYVFAAGLADVRRLRAAASLAFADWDLILTPTAAAMPWAADAAYPDTIAGETVGPRGHAVYTGWVNASGHPAIALPATPSPDAMPIGVQLVGDLGGETTLLELAERYEEIRPWAHRWPAIAINADGPEAEVR